MVQTWRLGGGQQRRRLHRRRGLLARTYRRVGPGAFVKCTPVWAEPARGSGSLATKEGRTDYAAGDYVVSNSEDGSDSYAVQKARFESMYEMDA
jgi:hypothetical protein